MASYHKVDIDNWPRKQTYQFYKNFADPYFGMTAQIDITNLVKHCKDRNESLFLNILYLNLVAINKIENFRMRYLNNELVIYDAINGGTTLFYEDQSFGFAYYDFYEDRETFLTNAQTRIEEAKASKTFEPKEELINLVHFSAIPWVHFTSFKHAQNPAINSSIPRITTGKIIDQDGKKLMPISIEVNHALMDGYHVGEYFSSFEWSCKKF